MNKYQTPFETTPFTKIKPEHFKPALEEAISDAHLAIKAIKEQSEPATFENTIEKLEYSSESVGRVAEVFFNLNSAETNEDIQNLARELSPMLSKFGNDIALDEQLFKQVKEVYDKKEELRPNGEQQRLLEKTYQSFVRNGANLSPEAKEKVRKLDEELSQLSLQFGENTLAATNEYVMWIEKEEELAGLPQHLVEAAAAEAEERGKKGQYAITLHMPSYLPFMTYADNRKRREELARAFGSRNFKDDKNDNQKIVKQIVKLRHQRAQLLGYSNHAAYILEERMAESPQKVQQFLKEILEPALPAAKQEVNELRTFAERRDGLKELQAWDKAYYQEKLKQEKLALDEEKLKPYFPLHQVIEGAFTVAHKLYGIHFEERTDIPKYHPDVKTFAVSNAEGEHVAVFYADFFPRKGKRSGAWMTQYRGQQRKNGDNERPHMSIVCNFTKPGKDRPSLLTFQEVLTLFHEFGHSLHGMMANTTYPSLASPNVRWDFVELPSQIMENWCYEKEALHLFARHYKTGEPIPDDLVEALRDSATFMEGTATVRQVSLATLDMSYHAIDSAEIDDVGKHEKQVMKTFRLFPPVEGSNISTTFGHIFQGGYSAGYYSYKWAEVLDADAFELFVEKGIFNREVAHNFQELLALGDTLHPSELYRRFRGQDPDPKALLRRAGLVKTP